MSSPAAGSCISGLSSPVARRNRLSGGAGVGRLFWFAQLILLNILLLRWPKVFNYFDVNPPDIIVEREE